MKPRQIDVLIEAGSAEFPIRIVVEARNKGRKLDVIAVDAFLTLLKDVQAHVGVMVCPFGYTRAAINQARNNDRDIYLEVLDLADLMDWQGPTAIPYSRGNGVSLIAPLGWVVDGSRQPGTLARLYERGRTQDQAIERGEFMYINFWTKADGTSDIPSLLDHQRQYLEKTPGALIEIADGINGRYKTRVRIFSRADHPEFCEITGFVEYDDFILMCVSLGPPEKRCENLRRTRFVMESALPMKVDVVSNLSQAGPASPPASRERS